MSVPKATDLFALRDRFRPENLYRLALVDLREGTGTVQ